MQPIQYLRSLIYTVQVYAAMAVMGLWFAPQAMLTDDGALRACRAWCRYALWSARWIVGIRSEIRGTVPQGEVMIAAKHQSFLDIILLVSVLPRPRFIMKRELVRMPVLGWFALRIGCIPVDRGKRGAAIMQMLKDVDAGRIAAGQLIIYPQGTRVAPGAITPYKTGTAILYEQLNQPCVPVAVNVGLFWPRHGILKRKGLAVAEFLETIPPGVERGAFAADLEARIEARSDALMMEAGWSPKLSAA
ncbi:acyltransferase family protein [Oceaniovalibus guishaninsula JLT2003]|uniref:Acyltransferase family protein n=1 Tax=Oceaniovalibus guishaninsula JLT2003 TaxID=1231392 RepID=K2HLH8_9RHOB|nr:lysophospholipid acyltransferase family protein [Oceaniovalibus guishaninsula]EKE43744.1 acyltransferase family protein [Oceaniovalibus guishaninsula JLT2003]